MSCPRSTAWTSPSDSEPISSFLSLIHLRRSTGRTAEGVAAAAPFVVSEGILRWYGRYRMLAVFCIF